MGSTYKIPPPLLSIRSYLKGGKVAVFSLSIITNYNSLYSLSSYILERTLVIWKKKVYESDFPNKGK